MTPSTQPSTKPISEPAQPTPTWNVQLDRAAVIAAELSLRPQQVERTLALLDEGATLPFIARYRKEATDGLGEVEIATISERGAYLTELVTRKSAVLTEIHKQGKLTDVLKQRIVKTLSRTELEDLYLPFKPKRRTRATIARERGLEPLAQLIWSQPDAAPSLDELAAAYINAENSLPDTASVLSGARDIVAEQISDDAGVRAALRSFAIETGTLKSRLIKRKDEGDEVPEPGNERAHGEVKAQPKTDKKDDPALKFSDYFEYEESAKTIPSHRMLALRRGEKEGVLRVTLELDGDKASGVISQQVVRNPSSPLQGQLRLALEDSWDRLLKPAVEVDVRLALRERADAEAIRVFAENLRHLLLQAPLGGKRVLALDPGYRTGCKLAVVDGKGDLLAHDVIFATMSESRRIEAAARLDDLVREHKVEAIAIGNGTASRETEGFVRKLAAAGKLPGVKIIVVSEAGASVYSTSEIGRQEFPTHDPTVRSAASIGRRLQDPLAELVKIEPKSIGVGQYQHDVHQPTLKKQLDQVVESCVNNVGVDVNTASPKLLQYVAGVGETLAQNIANYRSQHGPFLSRRQLLDVPRMGPKAFEQAAGFLRIRENAESPLDSSAVHPESYDVVERMAQDLGVSVRELVGNSTLIKNVQITRYIDDRRGEPTLRDILAELEKPGRDPRQEFEEVGFNPDVTEVSHLKEGMILNGVVTNVTNFGAFVDVGVHQDGLVHISELSHRFIKDPAEAVKVGDRVKVKVLKVELDRMRVGLSIKGASEPPKAEPGDARRGPRPVEAPVQRRKEEGGERRREDGGERRRPDQRAATPAGGARPSSDERPPRREESDRGRPPARDQKQAPSSAPLKNSPFNTIRGLNLVLKK
ncbi:MAG: RNA-binding transcriptional accessory protein [Myxococcales bacterium]|nr:RNA-binding transcriptional accessory protein [Myxococcales bacterium]